MTGSVRTTTDVALKGPFRVLNETAPDTPGHTIDLQVNGVLTEFLDGAGAASGLFESVGTLIFQNVDPLKNLFLFIETAGQPGGKKWTLVPGGQLSLGFDIRKWDAQGDGAAVKYEVIVAKGL